MSEGKYRELLEKFEGVGESTEQSEILYSLFARIAAGLENHEPGSEKLQISIGEAWTEASKRLDGLIQKDPKEAFDFALQLTMLPKSNNSKSEDIQKWIRGDGPALLAREELRDLLLEYLESGDNASNLVEKLEEYLSYDFSKINNKHDAFEDPGCFSSLATMFLGTKLQGVKGSENAARLFLAAEESLRSPKVANVIGYYLEFKETEWLAKELRSFLVANEWREQAYFKKAI